MRSMALFIRSPLGNSTPTLKITVMSMYANSYLNIYEYIVNALFMVPHQHTDNEAVHIII